MRTVLERQRKILDFALGSLLRRKGKNSALFLVYTLVVFLLASAMLLSQALRREASLVLEGAPDLLVQRLEAGRQALVPRGHLGAVKGIRGISEARGRLWGYYFDPATAANYTLLVPPGGAPAEGTIVLGRGIARTRGAFPGDILSFRAYDGRPLPFTVGDLLSADSELVSADLVLMSERDFRRLFGLGNEVFTDLILSVPNPREVPMVAEKVLRVLPDARPISRSEILRTYEAVFDWRSGILAAILSISVLAFAVLAWDKASGLSLEERREIGILKAVGWETSDVLVMKAWEGAAVSLTASLAGFLLAYLHVFLTPAALFAPVLKGWSTLYPDFRLIPVLDPYQLAVLLALTVVPYTAATILPSWRAATIDPDSVMRSAA